MASAPQVAAHFHQAAAGVKNAQSDAVKEVSLAAKRTMLAAGEAVNTPHTINTVKGRKGNAWGVRYLWFKGRAESIVFYWGAPPYWRERGTVEHDVYPRKPKKALKIGDEYRPSVHVKGVSARPFWGGTKRAVANQSKAIYAMTNHQALAKVFK